MAATNNPNSLPAVRDSLSVYTVPAAVSTAPYPPSPVEARCFYYGIPSRPLLVARSSTNVWVEPTGPEAYLHPKESSPIGLHPLREIWEVTVGPRHDRLFGLQGGEVYESGPSSHGIR
jgi:hypothetical protein